MRSWRNRTPSCAPASATKTPSSRRCEALFHYVGRLRGRGRQHTQLGSPAQTRHHLEYFPRRRRQGRQPGHRKFGHLGASQKRAHGRLVPTPPRRARNQDGLLTQRVEQLDGLIGIAALSGSMSSANTPAPTRSKRRISATKAAKLGPGRFTRFRWVTPGLLPPPRQRGRQRMGRVHLVAVGTHQQQALHLLTKRRS